MSRLRSNPSAEPSENIRGLLNRPAPANTARPPHAAAYCVEVTRVIRTVLSGLSHQDARNRTVQRGHSRWLKTGKIVLVPHRTFFRILLQIFVCPLRLQYFPYWQYLH